jgi:hypothetical protein
LDPYLGGLEGFYDIILGCVFFKAADRDDQVPCWGFNPSSG